MAKVYHRRPSETAELRELVADGERTTGHFSRPGRGGAVDTWYRCGRQCLVHSSRDQLIIGHGSCRTSPRWMQYIDFARFCDSADEAICDEIGFDHANGCWMGGWRM